MYIFDFDGTLSDSTHRQSLAERHQWDEFHSAACLDTPRWEIVYIYEGLLAHGSGVAVGILSAKPEKYNNDMWSWLEKHAIPDPDFILCRPNDDLKTKAPELKLQLIKSKLTFDKLSDIVLFDDRQDIVDFLLTKGIKAIKV